MSSLLWYVWLAVVSLGVAVYTIYIKKDVYKVSTLVMFYLFASCITWIGEFVVLGIFNSYAYKTGLFEDIWAQNLIGHLLLNTTMYPAAATVLVAYSLRYRWISLVVALFVLIEHWYLELGLYEQHWWRYYMSVIIVVIFSLISMKWFRKMNRERYGLTRKIILYFVAMLIIHIPSPFLLLLGKQHYQMSFINNLVDNMYRSSIIIIFIYHMLEAFLFVLLVCGPKRWYWKIMPYIISIVTQTIFVKMNILILKDGWKLAYTIFFYQISIAIFMLLEKYTLKPDTNESETNKNIFNRS